MMFFKNLIKPAKSSGQDCAVMELNGNAPKQVASVDPAHLNELQLARRTRENRLVTYNSKLKCFELYDPALGIWKYTSDQQMKAIILGEIEDVLAQGSLPVEPLSVPKLVNATCSILKLRLAEPARVENTGLIAVKNGVIDLRSNPPQLIGHDPKFHLLSASPVEYLPECECPLFTSELLGNAFPADDADLIQRYFGAVLTGDNAGQAILVTKGDAGAGKSTLVTVIESIIGTDNVAYMRTKHLGERFEMAPFVGKKLLVGKDVAEDYLSVKGANMLLSLVGNDRLEVERKNSNTRLDLLGRFHVAITCNSNLTLPKKSDANAWRRRLLVVTAKKKATTVIPNFAERILDTEAPGVLNWLIEGARKHAAELELHGKYTLTPAQQMGVEQMING